jgi:hypothetical protein
MRYSKIAAERLPLRAHPPYTSGPYDVNKKAVEMQQQDNGGNAELIGTTIHEICRPFGGVRHWQVESANEGLVRCSVRLADPRQHSLMVRTVGGRLHGRRVELDIRLRRA